jgi:hypothetical protein
MKVSSIRTRISAIFKRLFARRSKPGNKRKAGA